MKVNIVTVGVTVMSIFVLVACFEMVPHIYRSSFECPVSQEECEKTVQFSKVECKQAGGALGQYPFTQAGLCKNIYFQLCWANQFFSSRMSPFRLAPRWRR